METFRYFADIEKFHILSNYFIVFNRFLINSYLPCFINYGTITQLALKYDNFTIFKFFVFLKKYMGLLSFDSIFLYVFTMFQGTITQLAPNYDNFATLTIRTESLTLPSSSSKRFPHRPFYYLSTQRLESKIANINCGIHIPVVMCSTLWTSPTSNSQILNRWVLVTANVTSLT